MGSADWLFVLVGTGIGYLFKGIDGAITGGVISGSILLVLFLLS